MAKNPLHSKESPEWHTPQDYVEAARMTMGGIDLDPASCALANETVRAKAYYSEEDDGLVQPWAGKVFLNPPGGLVKQFWNKLVDEFKSGSVPEAIWVGYSLQQLQTLQNANEVTPLDFAICFPKKRMQFVKPGEAKSSPTHANYICYVRSRSIRSISLFPKYFYQFGKVI